MILVKVSGIDMVTDDENLQAKESGIRKDIDQGIGDLRL